LSITWANERRKAKHKRGEYPERRGRHDTEEYD
jgi:hypothetical protein